MNRNTRISKSYLTLLILLGLVSANAAHAVSRYWADPLGGTFSATSNWSATDGGGIGASVPDVNDIANFRLSNTYTVDFFGDATNRGANFSAGNVTLDLNNRAYTLTTTNALLVGGVSGQTARLTLYDGELAVNSTFGLNRFFIGSAGNGYLTLDRDAQVGDAQTNASAPRPTIYLGTGGFGSLRVQENAVLNGYRIYVGNGDSSGVLSIRGPQASSNFTSIVSVGGDHGRVEITDGGTMLANSLTTIGSLSTDSGYVAVGNRGSLFDVRGSFSIGRFGTGELEIGDAGKVATANNTTLGERSGSFGRIVVADGDSHMDVGDSVVVGDAGTGVLDISSGGRFSAVASIVIGDDAGAAGSVRISGENSKLEVTGGNLRVGVGGEGQLDVVDGAQVSVFSALRFGEVAGATGNATIRGENTRVSANRIDIGQSGDANVEVSGGAEMNASSSLFIRDGGRLLLDGGSIRTQNFSNTGTLDIADGLLQVSGVFIPASDASPLTINGNDSDDLPVIDLIGISASQEMTRLSIGTSQRGELRLRQGRTLFMNGDTNLGTTNSGDGTLRVNTGGSLISSRDMDVGGFGGTTGGRGEVDLGTGGIIEVNTLRLHAGGRFGLDGGALSFDAIVLLGGQFDWTSGSLQFNGSNRTLSTTLIESLLGPTRTLLAGQTLGSGGDGPSLALNGSLIVDGGTIKPSGALENFETLEIRSGTVDAFQNTATNHGLVQLNNRFARFGGLNVVNNGSIRGSGLIHGALDNTASGQIEVTAGEVLRFSADSHSNSGRINVINGELKSDGEITNESGGQIQGRNALLRFDGGLVNNGQVQTTFGTTDIFGDITNGAFGSLINAGGGSVTFYGDLQNNGEVRTTTGSQSVFFGDYSGVGVLTGGGANFFEGGFNPGASPFVAQASTEVSFGFTNRTLIELGGTRRGIGTDSEHDGLDVINGQTLNLNGILEIVFIDDIFANYEATLGDRFLLFTAAQIVGNFRDVIFPELADGLRWTVINTGSEYSVAAVSAVPVPAALWLMVSVVGVIARRRR